MQVKPAVRFSLTLCFFYLVGLGCSKPKQKLSTIASATPSASNGAPSADRAGVEVRAPIPVGSLKPPPLQPPPEALMGPGGVHFQILKQGDGDSPGPLDSIVIDYSMWTSDGRLAVSSYPEQGPIGYSVSSLAPNLRLLLTQLKNGSQARFWVPRSALAGWKPPEWPDSDLIFELQLLQVGHVIVRDSSGKSVEPAPHNPPDAAGPPQGALSAAGGLRYVYLTHAEQQRLPSAEDRLDLAASAYVVDGIEVKQLSSGIKTATTLARAPGGLAEVLKRLNSGDQVRVWLPKGKGAAVISEAGQRETILDLSVHF